jgi:hypothetical protein
MPLPVTDVQTYRLPLGEAWFFQNEQPPAGVSGRLALGWANRPLYARVDAAETPVVDDLLHIDTGLTARYGAWTGTVDASVRAVWEGPVGVANPRLGAAFTTPRWNVVTHWTLPVSTFDALLAAPTSVLDVSASYGVRWVRATVTATWRPDTGPDWRPSATGSVGIQPLTGWTLEGKAEYLLDGYVRAEAGSQVRRRVGAMDASVGVFTGLTPSVGTPRLRVVFSASWAKRPVPPAPAVESPVLPLPSLPPPPSPPAPPAPVEVPPAQIVEPEPPPAPAPPLDRKYTSVLDAAAGYFLANPTLRFIMETNGTKAHAEQVVMELQKRGILKERVVRIDVIPRRGPVTFDFVVVE